MGRSPFSKKKINLPISHNDPLWPIPPESQTPKSRSISFSSSDPPFHLFFFRLQIEYAHKFDDM